MAMVSSSLGEENCPRRPLFTPLTSYTEGSSCAKALLPSPLGLWSISVYRIVSVHVFIEAITRHFHLSLYEPLVEFVILFICYSELTRLTKSIVPPTAKWLTEKERIFVQARLPANSPRAEELNFNFREIIHDLKDIRLWMFTLIWATFTVGTSGVRFYQPTVIANLGFT